MDNYVTRPLIVSLVSSLLFTATSGGQLVATQSDWPSEAGYRVMAPLAEKAIAKSLR